MTETRARSAARRFAWNALLLIAVNLFMRTVGVSFNVYLSNRAGGEVMGLYSLLFGVYGLAMTLGCGGIHLGTTRLVAEAMGEHDDDTTGALSDGTRRAVALCLRRCLLYSLCCSVVAGALLYIFSPLIGQVWLGDERTVTSLRVLALTLPPISLSSCMGGYFTAVRRIAPNAAVGLIAQFARIGFCSYLLALWLPDGVESTCLALVLGGALSEVISFLLTWAAYVLDKKRHWHVRSAATGAEDAPLPSPTKKLLGITVPVTLSACLRSGLVTLQHILIPRGLKQSGASWESALASYGVVHGMVLPVVLFPSAFISSFSGLLVPEIAESNARGDNARVARISHRIITPALIFSFGVAGIMACFSHELGLVIYDSAEAGRYIRQLAPLIPIMYVDSSVDAVLKGMGEQVYSMNVNILDALCSVILVWLLLPRIGLAGYVVAIYVTETLNTTLSLTRMLRVSGMKVELWKQVFGPLCCVTGATCVVRLLGAWWPITAAHAKVELITHIALTAVIYLALLGLTHVVGREDIATLRGLLPPLPPGRKQKRSAVLRE